MSFSYGSVISDYLNTLKKEVQQTDSTFQSFSVTRGEEIFTSKHVGKKGKEISCSSCHGNNFRKAGENIFTGKVIKPLSRKINHDRFSSLKNTKKWLRRNFNDVYNKEGTALEKGDVITYILSKD